jgi:hypothetical protein
LQPVTTTNSLAHLHVLCEIDAQWLIALVGASANKVEEETSSVVGYQCTHLFRICWSSPTSNRSALRCAAAGLDINDWPHPSKLGIKIHNSRVMDATPLSSRFNRPMVGVQQHFNGGVVAVKRTLVQSVLPQLQHPLRRQSYLLWGRRRQNVATDH